MIVFFCVIAAFVGYYAFISGIMLIGLRRCVGFALNSYLEKECIVPYLALTSKEVSMLVSKCSGHNKEHQQLHTKIKVQSVAEHLLILLPFQADQLVCVFPARSILKGW